MSEHRIVVIVVIAVVGFFGFIISQRQNANSKLPPYTAINTASAMRLGNANAKVSIIQYSDFLCPSCSYVSTQVMPQVYKDYVQNGQAQIEFRPMAFIAKGSVQAGMGAYCAIDEDKFWTYHDTIYTYVADKVFNGGLDPTRDTILTADIVKTLAAKAGLDASTFNSCLDSEKHLTDITQSTQEANRNGINSTPYILVNGQPVVGNPNLQTIEGMIKAAL